MAKKKRTTKPAQRTQRTQRPQREHVRAAPDPTVGERRRARLPLIIAAVISAPLCWLSIRMSLLSAEFMQTLQQIKVDSLTIFGMWVMSAAGWLMTAATLTMLLLGVRSTGFRSRLRFSLAALACALAFPLSWTAFYIRF